MPRDRESGDRLSQWIRPGIRVRGLRAGYGERTVLGPLSFALTACCTGVVLGPGGAGKSTLLRVLRDGAPDPPDLWSRGHVHRPPGVCYLAQKPRQEHRSLADGLQETAPTADPADLLAKAWSAAPGAAAELALAIETPLSDLSFELHRLAELTLLLAGRAPLLLLDEPDLDLDEPCLGWMTECLAALRGTRTVLLATHNLKLARRVSDSAFLLIDGMLIESGSTLGLFERPIHQRTRHYVRMGS